MSPVAGRPEPPGLANERTALSWQRTALSVVVAALVVARLTIDRGWRATARATVSRGPAPAGVAGRRCC